MHPNLKEAKFQHKIKLKNSCFTSAHLLLQDVMHSVITSPPSAAGGQFPRSFLFFVTLAVLKNPVQVSCRMSATLGLSDVFSGLGWVEGGMPFSARPVRVT